MWKPPLRVIVANMRLIVVVLINAMLSLPVFANNVISNQIGVLSDLQGIQFLRDEQHSYGVQDLTGGSSGEQVEWQSLPTSNINFLYDESTYWFRFDLTADIEQSETWVLDINWTSLDSVSLYILDEVGGVVKTETTGDKSKAFLEGGLYRLPHFTFELDSNKQYQFLLQVKSSSSIIVPIRLSRVDVYQISEFRTQAGYGLFFGALLIMVFYNGFISVFTRDESYVFYVAYLLSLMFYQAILTGFGVQHLWGDQSFLSEQGLGLSVALSFLFGAIFIDRFLNLKKRNRFCHRLFVIGIWLYGALSILSLVLPEAIIVTVEQPVGLVACFAVFAIAWYEWMHGNSVARYFIIAWGLLLVGTFSYTLLLLGLVPRNPFTENIQVVGIGIEMLVLSVALADRINRNRIERMATLQTLMETSKERFEVEADAKARGEFFAKMSHEIRTPIGGVLGIAELLKDTSVTEKQRKYIDTIYNAGQSLLSIVNDILDFSKMDSGNLQLECIPFELEKLVNECVDIVSVRSDQEKIQYRIIIESTTSKNIMGDPVRLRQILLNFLGNAEKFTDRGEIVVRVSANLEKQGQETLTFKVTDDGIGLSQEQIGKLFQPFQQADESTTRRFGGTGLGLAICKELVELMGGSIGVDSRAGEGATFWFNVQLPKYVQPEKIDKDPDGCTKPKMYSGVTLLIAEDNPVNVLVLKGLLKKHGIAAKYVEDGCAAVELYKQHHVDIAGILMDCEMPILDGFEASKRIRLYEKELDLSPITIVALTAHSFGDFSEKAKSFGMDYYLTKPISDKALTDQIDQMLEGATSDG